jgi:hypothetical protein
VRRGRRHPQRSAARIRIISKPAPAAPDPVVASPWLTAEEAAAYCKRALKTVQNWTSDGLVAPCYIDRKPLYNTKDLDAAILHHRRRANWEPTTKESPVRASR